MNKKEPDRDAEAGVVSQKTKTTKALELLHGSVEAWNRFRKEHPAQAVEFNKQDFREADLSGIDLSGANLKAANFSKANLSNAIFRETKLNGANFTGADLRNTDFANADISGATLVRADISGANLDGANLSMTDLNHASLNGAVLTQSKLNCANLNECDMREAVLSWADLSGVALNMVNAGDADFHDTKLDDADFLGADLHETDMHEANLREADLRDVNLHLANLHDADLSGADLSEADLSEADLSGAHLGDARLRWTNLQGANLSGADFSMANLNGANMMGANLCGVEFTGANLCDANLSGASLCMANFRGAELNMANLAESETFHTSFMNLDLSKVKGLDSIIHRGPSEISLSTLFRSQGQLSDIFMRGCGVPESMIDHVKSMSGKPIDYLSCIISHSTKDRKFADQLYADLQKQGIRCWLCPDTLKMNHYLDQHIDRTNQCCEKMLLIVSDTSMTEEWLKTMVLKAMQREGREGQRQLFAVSLLRQCKLDEWELNDLESGRNLGRELRKNVIPSFYGWEHENEIYNRELSRLVASLKSLETSRSCLPS
jgi:uncharacterized protein YjbI with pentapeptide repeats